MSNEQLREALQRIQYKAVSLADAQVIALEALASQTTSPAAAPAPASSQDEPFGYFRAEPFGWTDCAADDEGAIALYERPAAPAVPQGIPAHEVIDAIEAWKSAWARVPPFGNKVNKATREAITFSHNTLFQLLWSAQQAQRMPKACPTTTGCGPHGCHGACITATPTAPSQEPAVNLSCKSTQARLAAQWGYVPAPSQPVTLMEDAPDPVLSALMGMPVSRKVWGEFKAWQSNKEAALREEEQA